MKIIEQSHEILSCDDIEMVETAGRTCYQTGDKIGCLGKTGDPYVAPCGRMDYDYINCRVSTCEEHSSQKFAGMLIRRGHHAMIEFGDIIVRFITNRGVTHELVRHRHCSFAQESTRYVKYGGGGMTFIRPEWISQVDLDYVIEFRSLAPTVMRNETCSSRTKAINTWIHSVKRAEEDYNQLLLYGWKPQQAREVLPNSLKTEIVMKANFREWAHILTLRTSKYSHPQMRALMLSLLAELKTLVPVVFDNI